MQIIKVPQTFLIQNMASRMVFSSPATVYTEKQIQDRMIYFLKALEASIQSMTALVNLAYL